MTYIEIIKALGKDMDLIDLIDRQQEEIERLEERIAEINKTIKSNAIKEFAKRLKKVWWDNDYESPDVDFDDFVDNIVKEMVGDNSSE